MNYPLMNVYHFFWYWQWTIDTICRWTSEHFLFEQVDNFFPYLCYFNWAVLGDEHRGRNGWPPRSGGPFSRKFQVWDDHFPPKKTTSKGSEGGGGGSQQAGKVDRDSLKSRWDQNDDPLNKAQINHQWPGWTEKKPQKTKVKGNLESLLMFFFCLGHFIDLELSTKMMGGSGNVPPIGTILLKRLFGFRKICLFLSCSDQLFVENSESVGLEQNSKAQTLLNSH